MGVIKPLIVTFSGKAGHAKDTSANFLKEHLETVGLRVLRVNMADFLKYLAKQYMGWDGNKDEVGRTLLQTLGTEKVRHRFPDMWVDTVINIAKIYEDDYDVVAIGDVRFHNEVERWNEEGYETLTVHVFRPDFDNGMTAEQLKHPSETALDGYKFDVKLVNSSLDELRKEVLQKVAKPIAQYVIPHRHPFKKEG